MKDKIFKIFSSSIKVRVTGRNVNNFIKKLIRNRISIINVIPKSYKEVDIIIDYNDLDNINKLKSIYDIKIIDYYGKLRILKLIKKNIFIISFLILGIILIYILSNIIFSVEVIHSNSKIVNLLKNELSYYNIKKYSFVKNYDDIEKIEKKILENNKDSLEWLEIIRDGTKYIVRVEERIINDNRDDNKKYDVVASKNAVIKSITAESGEKVKEVNTYVKGGDIIISSNITLPNNDKIQGTASGKVIGEVWYTVNTEYPYFYNEIVYTGNKKRVLVFNFVNKRFSLFDFDRYKSFDKNVKYIFKDNFIPIDLSFEYQYETNVINDIYTYEEAKNKAIELVKEKLFDKYSNIVKINEIKVVNEEDMSSKIKLSLFISCDEDITEYKEAIYEIEEKR